MKNFKEVALLIVSFAAGMWMAEMICMNESRIKINKIMELVCPDSKPVIANGEFVGCTSDKQSFNGWWPDQDSGDEQGLNQDD